MWAVGRGISSAMRTSNLIGVRSRRLYSAWSSEISTVGSRRSRIESKHTFRRFPYENQKDQTC